MQFQKILKTHHFPQEIQSIFQNSGIKELYPPQVQAIASGVLERANLLMSVPTAAGKTLIAELVMLKALTEHKGRCLYIVPLKALASEKFEDFKAKYSSLGIKVSMATGDSDLPEKFLMNSQILIATAEKIDSLLRSKAQWLINSLNVVVFDEIHFINDGSRGPTLEILISRIKQLNSKVQFLALSATIGNAQEMADWLKAQCVESDFRPIPLREGVYFQEKIRFRDHPARQIMEESSDDMSKLCLDTIKGQGQVLIFVNSRRSSQAVSQQVSKAVWKILSDDEKKELLKISQDIVGPGSQATKICRNLGSTVMQGAAFHHAGLKPKQRKLIEDNFKKNLIKVICATPTLAAGVNLPARRAVIRDHKRFEGGLGSSHIPTSEYKQCAGRAGRPQFDEFGEAVLIAKSSAESKKLFKRYIDADPEPVISKLGRESALRVHILASIAGGYVHDINDTFEFMSHTFLAHQKQTKNLIELISRIFDFLQEEKLIEKSGFRFFATAFGQCTSRLYIDPLSSIIIRDGLNKINSGKSFSNIGLLHLIGCCPDSPLLKFSNSEVEKIQNFASQCEDELIMTKTDLPDLEDIFFNFSLLKTAMMGNQWINEKKEEDICDEFNIGPGDIYRQNESARWLLHAAIVFADLFKMKKLAFPINDLKSRVQYGIKEELIALSKIKGIGRIRARLLYKKGFKKPADLKFVRVEELAKIETIGTALAKDIIDQVTGVAKKTKIS